MTPSVFASSTNRLIKRSDLFIVGSKQTNCVLAKENAPLHASNDFAGTVIRAAKRKREWKLIIKEPVAVKPFSRRFNGTSCFIMLPRLTWTISQICISRMHAHLLFAPILASTITKFYIFLTSSENPSYREISEFSKWPKLKN